MARPPRTNSAAGRSWWTSWMAIAIWSSPPAIVELRQITSGSWRLAEWARDCGGTSAPSITVS